MLSGESLTLRPIERGDLVFLRDLANDPGVRANVVGWDWPLSLHGQEQWFAAGRESDHARRLLIETHDGRPIGITGLWDIDWRNRRAMSAIKLGGSDEPVRGRGYGSEALRLMMDFAFGDVGLHRLTAQILEFNQASRALYAKCGWVEEGISRQHVWRDGTYWDVIDLGILRSEYLREDAVS